MSARPSDEDQGDMTPDRKPENDGLTQEQRLAALRRAKKQAEIAEVQRKLNAPQQQRDARLIERHGSAMIVLAKKKFPSLTGWGETADPQNDQIASGFESAHRLVDAWLGALTVTDPKLGKTIRAVLASQDYCGVDVMSQDPSGVEPWRKPQEGDPPTFGMITNTAVREYDREFASATAHGLRHRERMDDVSGFTLEDSSYPTPDTRVCAIVARWPFARTPIATVDEMSAYVTAEARHHMCDLWTRGGGCDGASWSESILIPVVRGDVIVCVAACTACLKRYCKSHGISDGEIVDPETDIL